MLQQRNEICHGKVLGKWSCDGEISTPNIHLVKGKHRDLGVSSSNTRKYNRIIIEQIICICRAHMRVVKRRKTTHFPCRVICRVCTKQSTQKIAKILWMGQQNPKNQLRDVVYPWLFDFL